MRRVRRDPYAVPTTVADAEASLIASPLKEGELEVCENLALEGVTLRPQDYMRLVVVVRQQAEQIELANELLAEAPA